MKQQQKILCHTQENRHEFFEKYGGLGYTAAESIQIQTIVQVLHTDFETAAVLAENLRIYVRLFFRIECVLRIEKQWEEREILMIKFLKKYLFCTMAFLISIAGTGCVEKEVPCVKVFIGRGPGTDSLLFEVKSNRELETTLCDLNYHDILNGNEPEPILEQKKVKLSPKNLKNWMLLFNN